MEKKVAYMTQWIARDRNKPYPHGWGFIAPIVEFNQDRDSTVVGLMCMEVLSNKEFECIGVVPVPLIDGEKEIFTKLPTAMDVLRDIDLIIDHAEGGDHNKLKEIAATVNKYLTRQITIHGK